MRPQALTKELLDYLRVCDLEFKPDLTAKVCQLIQRYSPERRWYIDSMLQVRFVDFANRPCCTISPVCLPATSADGMLYGPAQRCSTTAEALQVSLRYASRSLFPA